MDIQKRIDWSELQFKNTSENDRYRYKHDRYTVDAGSALYKILGIDHSRFALILTSSYIPSHTSFLSHRQESSRSSRTATLAIIEIVEPDPTSHRRQVLPEAIVITLPAQFAGLSIVDFKIIKKRYSYDEIADCTVTFKSSGPDAVYVDTTMATLEKCGQFKVKNTGLITIYGHDFEMFAILNQFNINDYFYGDKTIVGDLNYLNMLCRYLRDNKNILLCLRAYLQMADGFAQSKPKGISKIHEKLMAFYPQLCMDEPKAMSLYKTLAFHSGKAINKVKISNILNGLLENAQSAEEFADVMNSAFRGYDDSHREEHNRHLYKMYDFANLVTELPTYTEKRKKALQSSSTGAFNKLMQDIDFLTIEPEKYPVIYEAITAGTIPLSTFFRKSEGYFTFNTIWDLWEEMLAKYRDVTIELSETVRGRTTYEKDLMSYFYFILYGLPEYLERQTGKKWVCLPKLVNSASELEPPKEDDDRGVRKSRSALTPIVDNEQCTVVVPYASLAIPGRQTTYCYSLNYNVLHKGLSINGDVCMSDVEVKLNGKDDYGLMFYTLTGSAQGRGYPTFLIIFEKLSKGIKVHFHRTHPMRSKDGDYNPISQWTKGCFKWMVGNVPYEKLKVQQGDLAFIETDKTSIFDNTTRMVDEYDSHAFETPVLFVESKKDKGNILGYIRTERPTVLHHPEHEDRVIPAGVYELRQAKSWEASPKGVWSLRID